MITDDERRRRDARRVAMGHVLGVIAASRWSEYLVLRGSVVLRTWLGEVAREPDDLDFVVVPQTLRESDRQSARMLAELVTAVRTNPGPGLRADHARSEAIETYDREGRRLLFPYAVPGLALGTIQVDFVWQEPLPEDPVRTEIQPWGVPMPTASPALSLAWKLFWLLTDEYPRGKDLFDAALLAEYTPMPLELVRGLLHRADGVAAADAFTPESVRERDDIDWSGFAAEYPDVPGDANTWLARLVTALTNDRPR